jgi:hypothetical protein
MDGWGWPSWSPVLSTGHEGDGPCGRSSRSVGILIETYLLFAFIPIEFVVIPPMMVH